MPAKPEEPYKPEEPSKPDNGPDESGAEVIGSSEIDGSEWVTWKPTTTTKNPWAWEPEIVTPPPVVDNDPLPKLSGRCSGIADELFYGNNFLLVD